VLVVFAFVYWAAFIQTVGASSYDPRLLDGVASVLRHQPDPAWA
jgi:hypothetical protein